MHNVSDLGEFELWILATSLSSYVEKELGERMQSITVWSDGVLYCWLITIRSGFFEIEFFELISKVQSNRADDQRGLLRKEDLVLPDFLHLPSHGKELSSSSPLKGPKDGRKRTVPSSAKDGRIQLRGKADVMKNGRKNSTAKIGPSDAGLPALAGQKTCSIPFSTPLAPILPLPDAAIWKRQSKELQEGNVQTVEGESTADLTLVAEGDISSPNSTLLPLPSPPLPLPPSSSAADKSVRTEEAKYPFPISLAGNQGKSSDAKPKSGISSF